MKVVSPNLKAASVRVSDKFFDTLKEDALFVAQIPNKYKSIQKEPLPYIIVEEAMLMRVASELLERELASQNQNKDVIQEYSDIRTLILKEKPVLIFLSR